MASAHAIGDGLGDITPGALKNLAGASSEPEQITHNHVFTVTPFDKYTAMAAANKLDRSRKALAGMWSGKGPFKFLS